MPKLCWKDRSLWLNLLLLLSLGMLSACGGPTEPEEGELEAGEPESEGRKRGWFYNGLSEHPKIALPFVESVAWRLPDANGQPLYHVWLSSGALSEEARERMRPPRTDSPAPLPTDPAAFGHAGVLLRFDQMGRGDGQMTDFCPRRNEQVQCLSMSGIGTVVVTRIAPEVVEGALYTRDLDQQQVYVAQFRARLRADEVPTPPPAELKWLGAGGGEPGAAWSKRNQAALDGDLDTLKAHSMPETAEFLDQPGNAALLKRLALQAPQILGGSQLGDSASLFVRDADNSVRRVDLQRFEERWRVQSARP